MENKKNWLKRIKEEFMANYKEAEEFKDLYTKAIADFNKYKKRKEMEMKETKDEGKKELMEKFFNVIENMGRALEVINENKSDTENLKKGVEMIYKQFISIFKEEGGEIINPLEGEEFNPEIHEAIDIEYIEDKNLDGKIIKGVQKGFKFKGKVVVPSKVIVGKIKEEKNEGSTPEKKESEKEEV